MSALLGPDEEILRQAARLMAEGREHQAGELLRSAIMSPDMIEAERRGMAMVEKGIMPSLDLSDAELEDLYSGYVALAIELGRGGKPSSPLMTTSLVVTAYQRAKIALSQTELEAAISAWWYPFNQLGLATQKDLGGSDKYDLSEHTSEFMNARDDHLTAILIEVDKAANRDSAAATSLEDRRAIAGRTCKRLQKAHRDLGSCGSATLLRDIRITTEYWHNEWKARSREIARAKARQRRLQRG